MNGEADNSLYVSMYVCTWRSKELTLSMYDSPLSPRNQNFYLQCHIHTQVI